MPGSHAGCSIGRAPRWGGAWEMCSTGRVFLLCVDCLDVQRCTAAGLLCCTSVSAVAAQCAGAVLGRYVIRCIPSCCVSVVQACRDALHAAKLLRCIFLSAVADAMRSVGARWKGSVLWSNPALRAAAAEGGALCSRFFAPAPLQNETIDYNKKDTHRTALFPNPAPARSAVRRTVHQRLCTLCTKF